MATTLITTVTTPEIIEISGVAIAVIPRQDLQLLEVLPQGPVGPSGPVGPEGPIGPQGPQGVGVETTYVHDQTTPVNPWVITHNLNRYPSVTVIDSGGSVVEGDLVYTSANLVTITFSGAFSGKAYLN